MRILAIFIRFVQAQKTPYQKTGHNDRFSAIYRICFCRNLIFYHIVLRLSFDSFCIYMACFHFLTSYFLLFLFNCCCPDICMISELRRQNNMHEFHPSHTKTICIFIVFGYNIRVFRGVAQPGRVLAWGARGRRFESCHPDHKIRPLLMAVLLM